MPGFVLCIDDCSACVCMCIHYTCTCKMHANICTGKHSNSCPLSSYTCKHTIHPFVPPSATPTYTHTETHLENCPIPTPLHGWSMPAFPWSSWWFLKFILDTTIWLTDCHLYSQDMQVWQVWDSTIWGTYLLPLPYPLCTYKWLNQ